ncbi:MAG TPA: hypothetical protein VF868_02635 [Bacteroidia bacterium]|jgi:hypothetical protein
MKRILLLTLLFTGISTFSHAQSAGKGSSEKSGGFFSRIFKKEQKPHGQMRHFDKQKKDPKMKNNGTSYRRNRKSKYNVDGDGFGTAGQGKQKRRRK